VDFNKTGKNVEKFRKILNKNGIVAVNLVNNLNKNIIYKDDDLLLEENQLKTR